MDGLKNSHGGAVTNRKKEKNRQGPLIAYRLCAPINEFSVAQFLKDLRLLQSDIYESDKRITGTCPQRVRAAKCSSRITLCSDVH